MYNKIIIVLILYFFALNLSAQNKYYQISVGWDIPNTINGFSILEQANNYIMAGSIFNNNTNDMWITYSAIVNSSGELLDTNEYHIDSTLFHGATIRAMLPTDYGYIMVGFINNASMSLTSVYLVRTNHNGELIDQTVLEPSINTNYTNVGFSICQTPDNGYLVGGYSGTQNWSIPYLCKLNADLQLEWDTLYEQYANIESKIRLLKPATNGNGYYAVLNINTTYSEGDIAVLRIDDNGTILEEHIYGESTDKKELVSGFIETLDNEYAITFYQIPNTGPRYCGLLKTDQINGIEWANNTMYYNGGLDGGVMQLPDSSFIVSGSYVKQVEPYDVDIELNKFSNSGQWLWTRHYGNEGNDYIYDMIVDSQGSLVFCGRDEAVNLPDVINGANVYLLKTNCMGLLTQPQAAFTATMDSAALTATFQNLSQFVYPDSIDGGHYIWEFGDGATSTQANPTHTYTQGGNYTVTLTAVVCSDTSVFVQEVSTWATGTNNVVNTNGIKVYPNPANDIVMIDTHLQNNEQATISICDITGHKLTQLPIQGTAKYQVNIATYTSGMYYCVLTKGDNTVQRIKLAIIK